MKQVMESFWRALLDSFSPRVVALSLLPLGVIIVSALLLGYFYWHTAVAGVGAWMEASRVWLWINGQLSQLGLPPTSDWLAPVLVVAMVTPVLIITSLLLVTMFMTPAMAKDVARRRFPELESRGRPSFLHSLAWSCISTALAVLALIASSPLWLIPPLALVLPPLIWGWLAYRVLSFDVLAQHANASERQWILQQHRWPLLLLGVLCGFLGAAPSVLWASGVLFAVAFPVLVPVAVWLFTWVFALTSLWYAHYCLEALARLRGGQAGAAPVSPPPLPQPQPPVSPAESASPVAALPHSALNGASVAPQPPCTNKSDPSALPSCMTKDGAPSATDNTSPAANPSSPSSDSSSSSDSGSSSSD